MRGLLEWLGLRSSKTSRREGTLVLPKYVLLGVLGQAILEGPRECGGVIVCNRKSGAVYRVPMRNTSWEENLFTSDGSELAEVNADICSGRLDPLVFYHSHPSPVIRISAEDERVAVASGDVWPYWLIVSTSGLLASARLWLVRGDEVAPCDLMIDGMPFSGGREEDRDVRPGG